MHNTFLRIADLIIEIRSRFPIKERAEERKKRQITERLDNFFYKGKRPSDIRININISDKLPEIRKAKQVFIAYHFQDGKENWRLLRRGKNYIYKNPQRDKKQIMIINSTFDRIEAHLLPKEDKGVKKFVWDVEDIIYDFLQVLLISYFARRNEGIFAHAVGICDSGGKGLLFAGKSGAGKSTTARIWYKHSKAMILNDDRIIIRRKNKKFFIYGCPWHGDFSDYLSSRIESAPLKRLFFIYHASKNVARRINQKEAFKLLYPAIFPAFWDRRCLENIASFSEDVIKNAACYKMGFVNDKKIIEFVRKIP